MIIPEIFLFDDAMIIPLKLAQFLSGQEKRLSDIVDTIPGFPKHTTNFDCSDHIKFDVITRLQKIFSQEQDRVNIMDGVRVDLDNGWGLIRASNTEPALTLRFEADNKEALEEIKGDFRELLQEVNEDLDFR